MGLDPIIANPAKMPDPLTQYNNALVVAQGKMGIDKMKREEADLNALGAVYKDSQGDRTQMRNHLINRGLGRMLPTIEKGWAELDEANEKVNLTKAQTGHKQAETAHEGVKQQKTAVEVGEVGQKAFEKALENHTKKVARISHDPAVGTGQIKQWLTEMFADPLMGPTLKARGETLEGALAELDATLKSTPYPNVLAQLGIGMEAATEQNITEVNRQDRIDMVATPKHALGAATPTTIGSYKIGTDPNAAARATKVNVNVPVGVTVATSSAKKFGEVVEEKRGEEFANLDQLNSKAPSEIAAIDKTLTILNSGRAITGWGAEARANLLAMAKTLNIKVDNPTLVNTQLLRQQIANSLFNRMGSFKAQGLNLTPMSNLDLDKLEKTGPQIADDPEALKQMFLNYRESIITNVNRYNELKTKFGSSPYTGETINKVYQPGAPAPVGPITPPPGAIAELKKNPTPARIAQFEKTFRLPPGSAQQYLRR